MYDFEQVRPQLEALCKRWGIRELTAFGSAVRENFKQTSDIDLIFELHDNSHFSLFDHFRLQRELKELLGRKVDLLTRDSLASMRNPYRKKEILSKQQIIYGS